MISFRQTLFEMFIAAVFVGMPIIAHAQSTLTSSSAPGTQANPTAVKRYWTPERLKRAKPMEQHPKVGADGLPENAPTGAGPNESESNDLLAPSVQGEGKPPVSKPGVIQQEQILPTTPSKASQGSLRNFEPDATVVPPATSSFKAFFTTGRVFPDAAVPAYPNSAIGKLFFTDPRTSEDFICSASVLRPRLVVTAGHCVTKPNKNAALRYFYTNFLFVPAYNNGAAPFSSWTSTLQFVTNTWYTSNGAVPNAQDVAMIIAIDQRGQRIGDVTGFLGYRTAAIKKNNLTMVGYPANLDDGERMEVNNAQTFKAGGANTFIYGSAMRGGSSGGPWIQDYGVAPVSNPFVALANNYVVGVTSYGPVATEPKYQGASNLDTRFLDLVNQACNVQTGNC